jgi:hypothetical protein
MYLCACPQHSSVPQALLRWHATRTLDAATHEPPQQHALRTASTACTHRLSPASSSAEHHFSRDMFRASESSYRSHRLPWMPSYCPFTSYTILIGVLLLRHTSYQPSGMHTTQIKCYNTCYLLFVALLIILRKHTDAARSNLILKHQPLLPLVSIW